MKLTIKSRARIYQALKAAGHWYIVNADQWPCCKDGIDNCFAILFDGFVQCKFSLLNNGRLVARSIVSEHYLRGLRKGKVYSIKDLIKMIEENPWNIAYSQKLSLDKCIEIVKAKTA